MSSGRIEEKIIDSMKINGWCKLKGKKIYGWFIEETMQFPLRDGNVIYMLKFRSGAGSFLTMVSNSDGFDISVTYDRFAKEYSIKKEDVKSTDTFLNKIEELIIGTIVLDDIKI